MINRLLQTGFIESYLYNEHRRIINRMQSLGYAANRGMCFGISHMGTQAILAKDLQTFTERLEVINRFSPEELANKVSDERQKLAFLVRKSKDDVMSELEFKWETESKKNEFKNSDHTKEITEKIDLRLKRIYDMLSTEEKHLLEIPAFFDGVQLLSSPYLYRHFFEDKQFYQNAEKTFPLVLSNKLSESGGIVEIESFSGVYSIDRELSFFFLLLQDLITQSGFKYPFSMSLSNVQHALTISYDVEKECWIFIDANQLPVQFFKSVHELCEKIGISFKCTDRAVFTTSLYTTKIHSEQFKEIMTRLKNFSEWKEMHAVTSSKASFSCPFGVTWLECAIKLGHLELATELLNTGLCCNTVRAFAMATQEGHQPILNSLSPHFTESKSADSKNTSPPLVLAALGGYTDIVKTLLEQKNNPDSVSNGGSTALMAASSYGHIETLKTLLAKNADPNILNSDQQTALLIACCNEYVEIVDILLQNKAKPDQQNNNGTTALMLACRLGNPAIVNLLLKHKANLNHVNNHGFTPMSEACREKKVEVVKILLNAGAHLNVSDAQGITPVIESAMNGSADILQTLIEYKASLNNSFNAYIPTLIEYAVQHQHSSALTKLLGKNYTVYMPNYISGFTALHIAAFYGHANIVQALIEQGADMNLKSSNGITALEIAQAMQHRDIAILLELQSYKGVQQHSDLHRRDAINKLIKMDSEAKSNEEREKLMADFKEIDITAQRLANISSEYKPDNSQRIKCMNDLNAAISQAYKDYLLNQQSETIIKNLKTKANEIASLAKIDHEKNSTLFSVFGKKSVLESKITEITQLNQSQSVSLWQKMGWR